MEERRIVTVLFADVTGSTALGEDLDPEELRALLRRYYGIAREVVASHGGTLEKFIGDAVMAVFGLERSYGDDAERAVSAAVELRARVQGDPELGELRLHFGLSTGEVVAARDLSGGDFLVTGDTVNVAARLQQAADPGQILATERTARAASMTFDFGPPQEMAARGRSTPVVAHEVLARIQGAHSRRRTRLALIGREDELEQLRLAARRAFKDRRPALVSVVAPAGSGKTRLLEEFLERSLPAVTSDATVITAQCLPYGQRLTYWPLRQALLQLLEIPEEADSETVLAAVTAWADDAQVAALLAATIGDGSGPAPDRAELFQAWRTAFEKAAARGPLVLVFEDLHWSSDSLLDLIEFVMQPHTVAGLLVIGLTRPELLDRRPNWGGGSRNALSLYLEPMGGDAITELVRQLLDERSPGVLAAVVRRAGGNPFYATELARAVAADLSGTLPDTVHAAVQARIDLLQPAERRVVQLGSVYGRAFKPEDIAALAGDPLDGIARAAESLAAKDLLRPLPGARYGFRHILIREVAYQSLPRTERARLHRLAGDWISERVAGREDPEAEILALHYREAAILLAGQRHAGPDAEAVRAKALHWLDRAALMANAAAAPREAARHLRHALELASSEEQATLYLRLGELEQLQPGSHEDFRKALDLTRRHGQPAAQELRILAGLLMTYMRWSTARGEVTREDLARLRSEAAELSRVVDDEWAVARYLAAESFYPFYARQEGFEAEPAELAEAEAAAVRAVEIAERTGADNIWSVALDGLGACATERGEWALSREISERRLAGQSRLNNLERLDAHAVVAWMSVYLGELAVGDHITVRGLEAVQPGQESAGALYLMGWRIVVLLLRGHWDAGLELADRAAQAWLELGRPQGQAAIAFASALDVARRRHDSRRVPVFAEVVQSISGRADMRYLRAFLEPDPEALSELVLSTLEFGHIRTTVAERALGILNDLGRQPPPDVSRRLLEWAEPRNLPLLVAQARRAIGLALSDAAELAAAEATWTASGAVPLAARAALEGAHISGDAGAFADALHVIEKLGDHDYLERVADLRDLAAHR